MSVSTIHTTRELRVRPSGNSLPVPTSLRYGLRNSESQDNEDYFELPPRKRRRNSDSPGVKSSEATPSKQPRVHVSATVPKVVIAGIQTHQWPPSCIKNNATPTSTHEFLQKGGTALTNGSVVSAPTQARNWEATRRSRRGEDLKDESSHQPGEIRYGHLEGSKLDEQQYNSVVKELCEEVDVPSAHDLALSPHESTPSDHEHSQPRPTDSRAGTHTPFDAPSRAGSESAGPSVRGSPRPRPVSQPASTTHPDDLPEELPQPFLARQSTPPSFADVASRLHHERYAPMPPPASFINLLTTHAPASRSTDTLLAIAKAIHAALLAWQDEYLRLDATTAPAQVPAKRPATGARAPLDPGLAEQIKEIELWGHVLGVEGIEYPQVKRGAYAGLGLPPVAGGAAVAAAQMEIVDGKRSRRRGADARLADGILGAGANVSEAEGGGGLGKRTRKPVRTFDAGSNATPGRKRRRRLGDDGSHDSGGEANDRNGSNKRGRFDELRWESRLQRASPTPDQFHEYNSEDEGTPVPGSASGTIGRGTRRGRGRGRGRGHARRRGRGRGGTAGRSTISPQRPLATIQQSPQYPTSPLLHPPLDSVDVPSSYHLPMNDGPDSPSEHTHLQSQPGTQTRPKPKSEKRSSSMTAWWAERKRKAAEERMHVMRAKGFGFDGNETAGFKAESNNAARSGNGGNVDRTKEREREREVIFGTSREPDLPGMRVWMPGPGPPLVSAGSNGRIPFIGNHELKGHDIKREYATHMPHYAGDAGARPHDRRRRRAGEAAPYSQPPHLATHTTPLHPQPSSHHHHANHSHSQGPPPHQQTQHMALPPPPPGPTPNPSHLPPLQPHAYPAEHYQHHYPQHYHPPQPSHSSHPRPPSQQASSPPPNNYRLDDRDRYHTEYQMLPSCSAPPKPPPGYKLERVQIPLQTYPQAQGLPPMKREERAYEVPRQG